MGENGIFIFDLRQAKTQLGANEGFIISNAMLDVFAPGDWVQPELADVNAQFDPAPTPVLPTPAPTATKTPTATPIPPATPTQPASTATSAPIETPAPEPQSTAFPTWGGLLVVAVIVAAVWWFLRKRK
jgi:hypothetical protein